MGQLSLVFLVVFLADASVTAWRRGDRRIVHLTVGGKHRIFHPFLKSFNPCSCSGESSGYPLLASLIFMAVVAVMGYELSSDTIHASNSTASSGE